MIRDKTDQGFYDYGFWERNPAPITIDLVREYFMVSGFDQTLGISSELLEIEIKETKVPHYFLIFKKHLGKCLEVYFFLSRVIYKANDLKSILDSRFSSFNAKHDKVNKKINKFFQWNAWENKTYEKVELKKEFI